MISAWNVYWVMQLDSIIRLLVCLAAVSGTLAFVCLFPLVESFGDEAKVWAKSIKTFCFCAVSFACIATFIPSSKTAAAIIILPKLTAPEVVAPVSKEAGELYGLAKQALQRALAPGKDEPKQ